MAKEPSKLSDLIRILFFKDENTSVKSVRHFCLGFGLMEIF
jgi:hypothetical protein